MFTGESVPVTFRAKKYLLTDLFDWFGKEMQFLDETEDESDGAGNRQPGCHAEVGASVCASCNGGQAGESGK